jgi:hypothetical protein
MALIGYELVRRRLDLPVFEVRRPAMIRPVTRILPTPDGLSVPAASAPAREDDLLGHLLFAFRHEGVNLPLLNARDAGIDRAVPRRNDLEEQAQALRGGGI